ncbi:response regulator [Chlorogloeopsis sp. ULAP01]|uniref:response regulator n=1 Tax=Chlorogloeopsis sp. ULAP01 TaxID=3056483 RepID=UPI0025AAB747|nr:response regulator [Chlorogloeopsis sp. ULAP01]MDM9380960.1 response regulator [Chlorogloeopsis sp. ULAP01]
MVHPVKKRILYVDDSQDNCELLSFILNDAGYEIETVQSVTEGLRVAESGKFNLYLVDLYFWDGTGFELIDRIRAFDQSTPIVVCSGDLRESVREELMRVGVQTFLTKPIDPDQVARTIAEILGDDLQS